MMVINYQLSQDLFAKLAQNGQPKVFSLLDLKGAFNQLFLDEESARNSCVEHEPRVVSYKKVVFWRENSTINFPSYYG